MQGFLEIFLDLLLHALVFVVEAVVGAGARATCQKTHHFVLVQIHGANVGVPILVVIVKDAALAVGFGIFLIFLHGLILSRITFFS